jgi:hypothetical protein
MKYYICTRRDKISNLEILAMTEHALVAHYISQKYNEDYKRAGRKYRTEIKTEDELEQTAEWVRN